MPFSIFDRKLKQPRPFLLSTVKIMVFANTRFYTSLHKRIGQGCFEPSSIRHVQRPIATVVTGIELPQLLVML